MTIRRGYDHAYAPWWHTRAFRLILPFILGIKAALVLPAHAGDGQKILLRNASLVDTSGEGAALTVNVVIEDGVLQLITQDAVSVEGMDFAYDVAVGFVLGNLSLGEPASFLILDGDPVKTSSSCSTPGLTPDLPCITAK